MTKTATRKPKENKTAVSADTDAVALNEVDETVRKCIVTGQTFPKERLIRFCVSPDRVLVPDLAHKLPGRGIWVLADKEAVQKAVTKNLFVKPAGGKVTYMDDMVDRIELLLAKRCQDLLGVARKAGLVVSGFEKVVAALQKGRIAYLLEATDGGADGQEKIVRLAKNIPVLKAMTGEEMGRALGRDNCIHCALKPGKMTDLLVSEINRFLSYRHND